MIEDGLALKEGAEGGVHPVTVTVTLPLLLVQPSILHVAVYVFVDVGLTDLDVPVPKPSDHVIVPPEQPLAERVELLPEVIEDGLALNEGAEGGVHDCS